MMLFDSHAHYDDPRFSEDRDAVLRGLANQNVGYVTNIGADMPSSRKAVELAQKYDFIYAAVGVHPHDAKNFQPSDLDELTHMLGLPKVQALGEIGLDYHYDLSERSVQQQVFEAQLALAEKLQVPVVIHEREASQDCLDILRKYSLKRAVYHCYSGSLETAKELVNMGFYLSFTGVVTFKNSRRAAPVIAWVPQDRIMVETDSPYLTPEPFRGRRNDSSYMHFTVQAIADIRGITLGAAAEMTTRNAKTFYEID